MRNFREYQIWQKAIDLGVVIYRSTEGFPEDQKYALASQLQRAAISISSNIAEGCSRPSETEFARFLEQSMGSAFELESQLVLAQHLGYIPETEATPIFSELETLQKQLNTLISKLRNSQAH